MKNIASNTFGYTGIVTLSQYIGQKKVKLAQIQNTGGQALFNFFSECLTGNWEVAKATKPTKILLLNYEEVPGANGDIQLSVRDAGVGFIWLTTNPEKVYNPSACTVRYSFMISGDMLRTTEFNGIGLYTNAATEYDYNNYAAFCKVDKLSEMVITPSSVLVVDWELNILNKKS